MADHTITTAGSAQLDVDMVAETDVDAATTLRDQTEQAETEDSPVSSAALDKSRQDSVIQPPSGTGTTTSGDTANERVPSMPSLETATDLDIAADKTEQDVQTTETALPAKATTITSMDVDTDPTQPRWSDHEDDEEEAGVLLPQPETFAGRSTKTGYVYDVRMRFHNNVHGDDDHPEDPRRIWRIFDALNTAQCTDRMIKIPSREATVEELNLVHTESHIENITKTTVMSKDNLLEMANGYNSIYLNNSSAFCARLSCGSLIELCKAVALGQVLNGLAIIRPPGHHAEPDEAGGFCLYNNVAIAARYLQQAHGLKKIFILDWDVHHGNGTQTAFYDDPDVLYCSIHRYDYGTFYPGDPIAAAHTAIGEGRGRGRTINIPWNTHGMGDSEYIYAFNKVIMPVLYEFAPDFVLVSAGFDAAKGDHIGQMLVTPPAYGHMTQMLRSLAGGKIILALEGGYNLDSIAVSGLACARALLNDPIEPLGSIVPNVQCVQTIHEVIEVQSRYWKSLPQVYIDQVEEQVEGRVTTSMTKIQEVYRQTCLREKHGMIKMPKLEGEQENEFLDNVYCTLHTYNSKPLYIFVHDIGEFYTKTLSNSNVIRPDKSVLVDTVSQYVDHIVESENELIDVVVPYQPGSEDDKVALKDSISALLAEIWDNYVSTTGYMGRRIILLATGFGCHGLVAFMNERQKEVVKHVSCVTLVPGDDSLPMVTKKLGPWYMENSFVVLTADHPVWERAQKSNNRTGNLVRSEQPTGRLSELLNSLRHSIFNDIDAKLESLPPVVAGDDSDLDFQDDPSMETDMVAAPNKDSDSESSEKSNGDVKAAGTPPAELHPLTSPTVLIRDDGSRPKQTLSHPGSPLQSGSTIPRPIVSPLVDRPTVVGQQHRLQPYPAPGGRSQNSAAPVTVPGSAYAHGSAPLSRGPDSRPPVEVHDSRPWPMAANSPQQHPAVHADEQRPQPTEHHPSVLRHQQGRQDGPTQPYQGGERRVARTGGPREYYPTPSTSSNSAAVSPSMRTPPHYSTNGSPRAPHSSLKTIPPQPYPSAPTQQPPHHGSGYNTSMGNSSTFRAGPPPQTSLPSGHAFEPTHYHRSSYSSSGHPPGPPASNGQPHHGPAGNTILRQDVANAAWSQQQLLQRQQQQQQPSNRTKRSGSDPDPYGQYSHGAPRYHPQQEMERQQRMEMDRQRWEMDQQVRQQKAHQRMEGAAYEMHGQQQHQQQQQQQHQQQQLFEHIQERGRGLPMMVKHPQHLQHQHPL